MVISGINKNEQRYDMAKKKKKKTPSVFQKAIFKFIKEDTRSVAIMARAGSGKTKTIVHAAKKLPSHKSTLFCAFNKSIAEELERKLPVHIDTMTLNSLGAKTWSRHAGSNMVMQPNKTLNLIHADGFKKKHGEWYVRKMAFKVFKMVSVAKAEGILPSNIKDAQGLTPDTVEVWDALIEHHDISFYDRRAMENLRWQDREKLLLQLKNKAIEMAREILTKGIKLWNVIDFDDQLYMPVIFGAKTRKYHNVFIDEAQDISLIQRALLRRCLKDKGRLIAVGDPYQAIYGFRGADSQSMKNIINDFECVVLPLSISYRCPTLVIAEAQKYVKDIEAAPNAPEGKVEDLGDARASMFEIGDFVLCRNSGPLIKLAFSLLRTKKKVVVLGKDIGQGLINLIYALGAFSLIDLKRKLEDWCDVEVARLKQRNSDANVSHIMEKFDCLDAFLRCANARDIDDLIDAIKSLFGNPVNKKKLIVLSTVHKSKGLEAKRVFILDFHLMPSKWANMSWQLEQEKNLQYVAVTRSKSELYFVKTPKKIMGSTMEYAFED